MSVNNTVNDQSTFNYITIVNPDSCRETVEVSQPLVNVIEVATVGPAGATGAVGANGSSQPFANVSGSIWATTSSIQITGSFTVSGSSTFTNIGLAVFTGSVVINGYSALTSNDTGSFLISSLFNSFSSSYYVDSGSVSNRITNLELFSSSLDSTFATDSQLNSATASLSSSISSLNSSFQLFSGSYNTGSFTGVFYGTSSWSTNSITASYAPDYVLNASTSSMLQPYVLNSSTSSFVLNSQTSSMTVLSSSFSLTASFINPLNQNVSVNGNVSVTGSIYIPDNTYGIYFSGSSTTSKLIWNDTDGTLDLGLKGGNVTIQIGQKQVVRIVNKTGISLTAAAYQVVKISGAQGNRLKVALALGDSDVNSADTIGIVTEDISLNQEGFVTNSGLVRSINTTGTLQGETWNDGDVLYLSPTTAGAITNIKPQAPQHTVILGFVVNAHPTQGTIFVKVDNGYEIDELHNVRITSASLTAGNLLVRNSNNVWVNSNQLTGSYFVTGSVSATSFTGSLFGTASWANRSTSSSFASTASYINTLNQNLSIFGNLSVFGTASFVQITGSVLQVGTNIITLNTDNPSVRFGGISVVDSGSFGTSSTGSLLWDSQNNRWVYSNPSGSTYDGGLLISGPRNTSGLGNESGMDANFVAVGQGADHIQPGTIYNSGSITIVTGSLTVTQGITGSLFGTASWSSNAITASFAPNYVLMSVTSSMLSSYVLNSQTSSFVTNAVTASMLQPYVLNSSTSSFVLNSQTSSFVTNAVTASMLSFYVLSTATSSFVTNSQTSSFVLNASTSSMLQPYVLTNITSSMLQPYVRTSSTSSMSVLSSSFASTASYISPTFISASAAASGFGSGGSSGITVGTTTITSGTSGRIPFNNGGVYGEDAGITYSSANKRLTLGGTTATIPLIARNSSQSTNFIVNSNNGRSSGAIGFWNDALSAAMKMSIMYQSEFSIYDVNASAVNMYVFPASTWLMNQVSVKTGATPTAHLHIGAGTATANTAPLKLTAGTNLTTPENGAFEFDGINLYFTVGGVRKTVTLV